MFDILVNNPRQQQVLVKKDSYSSFITVSNNNNNDETHRSPCSQLSDQKLTGVGGGSAMNTRRSLADLKNSSARDFLEPPEDTFCLKENSI
jgi:hypothetical protein